MKNLRIPCLHAASRPHTRRPSWSWLLAGSLTVGGCVEKVGDDTPPCTTPGDVQTCTTADQQGVELCVEDDPGSDEYVWSLCMAEACEDLHTTRDCTDAGGNPGVERCVEIYGSGERYWGQCAVEVCRPGTTDCDARMECTAGPTGVPYWRDFGGSWNDDCDTPLVLQFDEQDPLFSPAPVTAAAFDISGLGRCTSHDWPTAATPWLVRDLDRSGAIEGGHELFGSGTRLASGRRAGHGFEALAELDADGDRRITAADPAWSELLVWSDRDGDRGATGWELLPLAAYGVESLPLAFTVDPACDARGNCGRERASFTHHQGGVTSSGQLVDVHLVCE